MDGSPARKRLRILCRFVGRGFGDERKRGRGRGRERERGKGKVRGVGGGRPRATGWRRVLLSSPRTHCQEQRRRAGRPAASFTVPDWGCGVRVCLGLSRSDPEFPRPRPLHAFMTPFFRWNQLYAVSAVRGGLRCWGLQEDAPTGIKIKYRDPILPQCPGLRGERKEQERAAVAVGCGLWTVDSPSEPGL